MSDEKKVAYLELKDGTTVNGGTLDTRCPCGGEVGFTTDKAGHPDGVTHTVPWCDAFNKLGPIEFLQYVRGVA